MLADLQHIATASQVDIAVDIDRLRVSLACKALVGDDKALIYALCGGDDYQIAFTVPDKYLAKVDDLIKNGAIVATQIGKVLAPDLPKHQYQVYCCKKNKRIELTSLLQGYKV